MNYSYSDFNNPSSSTPSPPPPQPLMSLPPPPKPPPVTDFLASGLTQKQRKKRTKLVPVEDNSPGASTSSIVPKRKYTKPDPSAPKVTKPCSECGKTFWSWKALFGHMRCHPERHWRGINPPPNVKRLEMTVAVPVLHDDSDTLCGVEMTEEDHEVAACLLLLANGGHAVEFQTPDNAALLPETEQYEYDSAIVVRDAEANANCRFECSCCKKVFNSHQALGGHRASHKNVKGCFANTRVEGDEEGHNAAGREEVFSTTGYSAAEPGTSSSSMALVIRHSCSICAKVFATGQALGGHMRCHWEKSDEPQLQLVSVNPQPPGMIMNHTNRHALDLNTPAPLEHDPSSDLRLDLRLGL